MYLRGSKWSMNKRKRSSNPLRVIFLLVLVGVGLYINQVVVPATPPLFVPTPTATRSPESFILEAEQLSKEGKMQPAMAAYQQAVQADPKNGSNFLALAKLQIFAGKYADALTTSGNGLLLNPNNSMAHAVHGWALSFQGEYLQAEASFKRAIELDPNNAIAYAYYAEMIAMQVEAGTSDLGAVEKAIEYSRTAQRLGPNLMETHRARGIVLEITSNYPEATREFEAAVALEPNLADLYLALGRNYRFLEQYSQAVEAFNKANALNPEDPMPDLFTARTYAQIGEYAKAIQYAETAVKDAPADPYMWGTLGTMYYRNAQLQEALEPLKLAVHGGTAPESGVEVQGLPLNYGRVAEYYYIYGLSLARLGKCGEALQISQALLQGVKDDETSVYNAREMVNICEQVASGEYGIDATATETGDEEMPAETETPTP